MSGPGRGALVDAVLDALKAARESGTSLPIKVFDAHKALMTFDENMASRTGPVLPPEKMRAANTYFDMDGHLAALCASLCPWCAKLEADDAKATPENNLSDYRFHDEQCGRGDFVHIIGGLCHARDIQQVRHDLSMVWSAYWNEWQQPEDKDVVRLMPVALALSKNVNTMRFPEEP